MVQRDGGIKLSSQVDGKGQGSVCRAGPCKGQTALKAQLGQLKASSPTMGVAQIENGRFPERVRTFGQGSFQVVGGDFALPWRVQGQQGSSEPLDGRIETSLVQFQNAQLVQTEGVVLGLDTRCVEEMLGQRQMVGPDVFDAHVQEGEGIARRQPLGGPEACQGLIGFVDHCKRAPKGHPSRTALWVEASGATKVPLCNVIATCGVVVRADGKPGLWTFGGSRDPLVRQLKEGAMPSQ